MCYGVSYHRLVPPRCHLRRQDPQRCQACRSAGGAADEVRVRHQSESGKADRPDHSAQRAGAGEYGDSVKKAICNDRGGPAPALSGVEGCPPIRRADTQVGPYTGPAIQKRPRGRKMVGLFVIVVALTVCGARAEAQQPTKVPRIGFLGATSPSAISARLDAFRQGLRELGYVEGKNILIEYRYAEAKLDRLPAFAADRSYRVPTRRPLRG